MYASAWPSDAAPALLPAARRQRAEGRAGVEVAAMGAATRLVRLAQAGSSKVRLPNVAGRAVEAVVINTAGGIACGDRFSVDATAGEAAELAVSTPAAEKLYRSAGATAELSVRLRAAAGARIDWLPQETIFFDGAAVERRFEAELAPDATLLALEMLVLGRAAHDETVSRGRLVDRWRIRRGDRLVYADTLRLEGDLGRLAGRPSILGGTRALATLVMVGPGAETAVEPLREALNGISCGFGASGWNGLLAARFLAHDVDTLRRAATRAVIHLRRGDMPRVWRT